MNEQNSKQHKAIRFQLNILISWKYNIISNPLQDCCTFYIFSILCTSKHVHLYNSIINKASCHKWSIDDNKLHLPCFSLEMLNLYLQFLLDQPLKGIINQR